MKIRKVFRGTEVFRNIIKEWISRRNAINPAAGVIIGGAFSGIIFARIVRLHRMNKREDENNA